MLGISKTTDERSIKSAYARKLKLTRPEDDPTAFQALVEARDVAMILATSKREKSVQAIPAEKEMREDDSTPTMENTRNWSPINEAPSKQTRKPRVVRLDDNGHPILQSTKILRTIRSFLIKGAKHTAYEKVDDALASLRALPIDEKANIEAKLLHAVQSNLAMREDRPAKEFPANEVYDDLCRLIMSILNEVYEWTQNDRRVRDQLGWGSEDFVDQLQSRINNNKPLLSSDLKKKNSYWWLGPAIFVAWLILKSLGVFSTGN